MARNLDEPRGGVDASAAFQVPVDEALAHWGRLSPDLLIHQTGRASCRAKSKAGMSGPCRQAEHYLESQHSE